MQPSDVIIAKARAFISDPSNLNAEGVAMKGNRIIYVGSNEGVESFKDTSTRVING
jgi:predicted amidohydrolase YtcJ